MVDDMGWQDTSVPFWTQRTPLNAVYETPNMERLTQQGMLFTQAYAGPHQFTQPLFAVDRSQRCSPSRDKLDVPKRPDDR